MSTIALLGTMDTKGVEHGFVAAQIRARGHRTLVIDLGTDGPSQIEPDISREAVAAMSLAAPAVLMKLHAEGTIDGVVSLGGGGGTAIATAGMRALPLGFPKLMVSTLASGNTAQ